MIDPDDLLHERQQIGRAERPAFGQQQVVDILQTDTSELAKDIERVEDLLQVHEPNVPAVVLGFNDGLEGQRRAAMAAAGVEIDEVEGWLRVQALSYLAEVTGE